MTQSIEVKDFSGGMNNLTKPFIIYPNEAEIMSNISVDSKCMVTKNYMVKNQIIGAKALPTDPLQISPQGTFTYDMTTSAESYYEKVRFYQGDDYVIINGVPNRLLNGVASPAIVDNIVVANAPQTTLAVPDLNYTTVEKYTYFVSYRNSAGFESPLEEIGSVYAHRTFNSTFSAETASSQTINITTPPPVGGYGRIYRMGGNISFPSLVFQFDSSYNINLNKGTVNYTATGIFDFALLDDKLGAWGETWGGVSLPYLRYLVTTKFGLAAANGTQVYLSMNKPDAWSALSSLNFGSPIVGLASIYNGFLVFTESSYLYQVTGTSIGNLRVDLISTDVGCSSNSSIAEVGQHAIVWLYKRSLYMFNGASVREIEPSTYDYTYLMLQLYSGEVIGVSYENKYMLATERGFTSLSLEDQYKPFIDYDINTSIESDNGATAMREFISDHQRKIGVYDVDGSFWELEEYKYDDPFYEDDVPQNDGWALGTYTTPPITDIDSTTCVYLGGFSGYIEEVPDPCPGTDGALIGNYTNSGVITTPTIYRSNYKGPKLSFNAQTTQVKFHVVEASYTGEVTMFLYVDDVLVTSKDFITDVVEVARLQVPSDVCRGRYIQVELKFIGIVYSYRVDGEVEQAK